MERLKYLSAFCIVWLFALTAWVRADDVSEASKVALRKRLLEAPTVEEVRAVLIKCRKSSLQPESVEKHGSFVLANNRRLSILSHSVEGRRHYGAVITPEVTPEKKLPVVVMTCGGDGMSIDLDITKAFSHNAVQFPDYLGGEIDDQFVVVIPSFRGQRLIYEQSQFLSEGNVGDAFDGATTDALAFLNVVLNTVDVADDHRIAFCGGSRGGTVALLAAARDKRIKKTVVIAAPTDMRGLFHLYPDQFELLFFKDLFAGKISEKEARRRFIASSPNYFVSELPEVQLHHDKRDPFVPVDFARRLVAEMKANKHVVDVHYYDEQIHGFWESPKFWSSVQAFLKFDD